MGKVATKPPKAIRLELAKRGYAVRSWYVVDGGSCWLGYDHVQQVAVTVCEVTAGFFVEVLCSKETFEVDK